MNKGLEAFYDLLSPIGLTKEGIKKYLLVEKHLKALEIIRNIGILSPYETIGGQCWLETMSDATKITKENYDLLKEILL